MAIEAWHLLAAVGLLVASIWWLLRHGNGEIEEEDQPTLNTRGDDR